MVSRIVLISIAVVLVFASAVFAVENILIDNFNAAEKPNKLGGDFGAWNKDPDDTTQGCTMSFDGAIKHGDKGFSLKLEYDVDSENAAYGGFWSKLQKANFSKGKNLLLYVKGDEDAGFTTDIKLELKNSRGEAGSYILSGITKSWKEFAVPLSEFSGLTDLSSMEEFVITFDDVNATVKKGVIYVDDITVN